MEIKKKDYTRIYDLILAELEEKGYHIVAKIPSETPGEHTFLIKRR